MPVGRPRKFQMNDLAMVKGNDVVVVDYYQSGRGIGYYRVVQLTNPHNGRMMGPAVWYMSHRVHKHPLNRRRHRDRWTYKANERLEDRGCRCQCCPHTAMPRSYILQDGTYRDDDESEG